MTPDFRALQAILDVRRASADVVALCDSILLAKASEASRAMQMLPHRIRVLTVRAQRCLTALESATEHHRED